MNLLITICARGGSKGLPNKNVLLLNDKPLIEYTIDIAKQFGFKYNADIDISTDSLLIKNIAHSKGIITNYIRPQYLSTDEIGKIATIKDLLLHNEIFHNKIYNFILDLDVTSPLRNLDDLENAFISIQNNDNAINLFSVSKADKNPYFNMVELKNNGFYGLVKSGDFKTRQHSPQVYQLNASFYFYKRNFFIKKNNVINKNSLIYEINHICFDIDNKIDFEFMEYLLKKEYISL